MDTLHCCTQQRQSHDPVAASEGDPLRRGLEATPSRTLSHSDAKKIFDKADRIIHNGADVSHLKSYQSLKLANLQSTKELIEMNSTRPIPIHYISTAGIGIYTGEDSFYETSASRYPPPENAFDGYAASKWASERYLERVHSRTGWPVWIHRPSSVVRPGETTKCRS